MVPKESRKTWQAYAMEHHEWMKTDLLYRGIVNYDPGNISRKIYPFFEGDDSRNQFALPLWQVSPPPKNASKLMVDLYTHPSFRRMFDEIQEVRHVQLSEIIGHEFLSLDAGEASKTISEHDFPRSFAVQPVFDDFLGESDLVGFVARIFSWAPVFRDVVPEGTPPIDVVVNDQCGSRFFMRVDGHNVEYLENDDDFLYKDGGVQFTAEFAEFTRYDGGSNLSKDIEHCNYAVTTFPSCTFADAHNTNEPIVFAIVVAVIFLCTALTFLLYDLMVQRRQEKVLKSANRTNAIIDQLFPEQIKEKMLQEAEAKEKEEAQAKRKGFFAPKVQLQEVLDGTSRADLASGKNKPLAELFPEVSILFADLVGFTAWSSTREPSQVFELLEIIFTQFDEIANRRGVYSVETVGDCYVAACGIPHTRQNHAVIMARFADDCLVSMHRLAKKLEVTLGPDTADLGVRIGIHW
jgi:hypothetical protein